MTDTKPTPMEVAMREARDTTVETVARALAHDEYPHRSWHGWSESARGAYLRSARAAIDAHTAALSNAGLAVVPVEPTSKELSAIAAVYISGASDRIAGNPQRAVPAARQAWREIIDAALPPLASGGG